MLGDAGLFVDAFARHEQACSSDPGWLRSLRREAFAQFNRLGLPRRTDEEWRYTSTRPISGGDFQFGATWSSAPSPAELSVALKQVLPAGYENDSVIVLVNGGEPKLWSEASPLPSGATWTPLSTAVTTQAAAVQSFLSRTADFPQTNGAAPTAAGEPAPQAFTKLSEAFFASGVLLQISPAAVTPRIHLVHVQTSVAAETSGTNHNQGEATPLAAFPRYLIALAAGASAEVSEIYLTLPNQNGAPADTATPSLVNAYTDIALANDARLTYLRRQCEGPAALHIGRGRAHLEAGATLQAFAFSAGAKLARTDFDVVLAGEGAGVELNGLYLAKDHQHVDHHTTVEHLVPDATSRQLYKGILGDSARAVFNGKVFVRRNAQRTSALQMNRNLLLSSEAEIDTKPELQIDADDVKCAHGASIGQLNSDQLFYLTSRGLTPEAARQLLAQAFAAEVLMTVPGLNDWLGPMTKEYFA